MQQSDRHVQPSARATVLPYRHSPPLRSPFFFMTESQLSCVRNRSAAVWSQKPRQRDIVHCPFQSGSAAHQPQKRLGVTVSQDISLSSPHPPFFQPNGALSSNVTHPQWGRGAGNYCHKQEKPQAAGPGSLIVILGVHG